MPKIVIGFYLRLVMMVMLWLLHVIFGSDASFANGMEKVSITYWLSISYFAYFCFYLIRLKCNSCGEPVIYKTVHYSGWRLPKSHCSRCKKEL
ncbi:hypothetical protein [Motilimonas eburnea]|uniref:hypothetical protein n=1 Tax=Motilimonas eburnea TaxID=1737488 RepID=UPI001E2EB3C9|nr:hypothetical protein [Motilimonas eburnea]MCE2571103.1 hypothetical protein [Motilimonas eburnea]